MTARVLVAEPLSETGLAVLRTAGLAADVKTDLSRRNVEARESALATLIQFAV